MAAITPMEQDYAMQWRTHQLCCLQLILIKGKDKLDNSYKNGPIRRAWGIVSLFGCVATVCSPCVVWDTTCVALHCIGCGTNCYGCSCMCVSKGIEQVYERNAPRFATFSECSRLKRSDVIDVCKQFCVAFDTCIAQKTVEGARKANLIRERLVEILSNTIHPDIHDDGDINKLRRIVFG